MGNIILLDDTTINKIAAGEVIERPASAVKELLENSIDAGATNITIEIKNGGISYIRVTDNGKGILPDDMDIAFERHATSKIRVAQDIETVKSMGFRGEALASIASISRITMKSKTEQNYTGNQIIIEGGNVIAKGEIGCPNGTSITIEDLFYNTPVRYKFLKKDFTEAGYIEDVIERIALAHPEISIKYVNTGKTIISTSGNGDIKAVIYAIYGRDIAENIINVDYEYENIKITGVVGKPEIARSNRSNQLFFVNKRYIKDKILTVASEQAFKNLIPVGKYGFLILNIELEPTKVDVNVHPAKLEVRFQEEQNVFKAVYNSVKNALENSYNTQQKATKQNYNMNLQKSYDPYPSYKEMQIVEKEEQKGFFKRLISKKEKDIEPTIVEQLYQARKQENSHNDEYITNFNSIMQKMAEMQKSVREFNESQDNGIKKDEQIPEKEEVLENEQSANMEIAYEKEQSANTELPPENWQTANTELPPENEKNANTEPSPENEQSVNIKSSLENQQSIEKETVTANIPKEKSKLIQDTNFEEMYASIFGKKPKTAKKIEVNEEPENYIISETQDITSDNLSLFESIGENDEIKYKYIGIANNNFIIIEIDKELYILDQMAANVKIRYEELKQEYKNDKGIKAQQMLLPDIINLTEKQMLILQDNMEIFEKAGFELEQFGQNTIKLTSVPTICINQNTEELFKEILEKINKVARTDKEGIEEKFLTTIASKISQNSTIVNTPQEVEQLIKQLLSQPDALTIGSEKQVVMRLSKAEIEKKFSRR